MPLKYFPKTIKALGNTKHKIGVLIQFNDNLDFIFFLGKLRHSSQHFAPNSNI